MTSFMKLIQTGIASLLSMILLLFSLNSCDSGKRAGEARILIFSKTAGFVHNSIPDGIAAIQKLGSEHHFSVDTTSDASMFKEEVLEPYAAIVFLNTTGNVLDHYQEAAFERYIQAGGGFVGVHSATDTEYDWGWYGKLVGGYFKSHPKTQEAKFVIKNQDFAATNFFAGSEWVRTDELYNFKKLNPDVNVLVTVDENSYEGGENGDFHPMSWYHEYDGGRAFYTALGHTKESYQEDEFLQHLLGGIQYAIGDNQKLDYSKANTQIPPEGDRFSKVPLAMGKFFEPTEMTILPNHDVLIAQRRGELLLYKAETGELNEIATLDVYHKTNVQGVNAEEGFMGLQKDPNYEENNWIYAFYSPVGDEWVNRLSRFKYKDGVFDKDSEQVILDVKSQREICCHTGGSIAFGPDGLLYLSTGDNSTPFNEKGVRFVNSGYAPLNDVPGHRQYDARRSSGNTNDLRGKILRIKVNEDGSYDIPDGNLFPVGTEKTRPEIYTMGHRNPYRISVDPKKGYVYWGDVGPDSRIDSFATRGPRGYDEMNQARSAGNFGWPLFIADNKAYRAFDYATGESGELFDPNKPINTSIHNTGLRELPPAQGAYLFYDYGKSNQFSGLKSGGRNAMAGPVYYADLYSGDKKLPAYYDGKVLIYDWIRGWMKAVTLFPDGTFNKKEPFAPDIKVSNLIDMEMGPDGRIYLLEYGSGWFSANDDSGLSYITFNGGNRPPVIASVEADHTSGVLPLSVNLTVDAKDREDDAMSYRWTVGNGEVIETEAPKLAHTFTDAGEFMVSVEVVDDEGASAKSDLLSIVAGNSSPEVAIEIESENSSFFIPGRPIKYKVSVSDPEDGPEGIDESNIFVSVDYMDGLDAVNLSLGHQVVSAAVTGKALTLSLDCKACHKENEKSVGPSYLAIAKKYQKQRGAARYLREKIKNGGGGVWGEVPMAAHPDLADEALRQIVVYVRSLAGPEGKNKSLPPSGTFIADPANGDKTLVMTASYTDNGADGAKPLTGTKTIALRSNTISFNNDTKAEGFRYVSFGKMNLLITPKEGGWFALEDIDLTGIKTASIRAGWQAPPKVDLELELRLDSPEGKLLGKGRMPIAAQGANGGLIPIKLNTKVDLKAKEVYVVYKPAEEEKMGEDVYVSLMDVSFGAR